MRRIVLIVGLLAAFVSFSAVAAMTDIYDSPYYSEGGGGSGLWILLIPIIAFVLFYGGKTGRNGLAWVVGMFAGLVAVSIGSMYLANMLLGRPVSKEVSWLGILIFCGIWFGGLNLWKMSGRDKDTPAPQPSESAPTNNKLSFLRRSWLMLLFVMAVVLLLGVFPYRLITGEFKAIYLAAVGFWVYVGHYAYNALFRPEVIAKEKQNGHESGGWNAIIPGIVVACVIGAGIYAYGQYKNRDDTKTIAVTQPPTVAPQQSSPPIQTNSDSGLPPCIGTKVATWTNCTGALSLPDGYKYDGEWREGYPNGQGTSTTPDGDKSVGEFRDSKMHGQGTLTFSSGNKYVGEWRENKRHGQGTFTWPDGRKYVGEWRGGKLHGHGTFTYADGKQYVGEFRDDARNGQGTLMFPDGARFVGEYKDGKRNGQGTMTHPDGSVLHSGLTV